MVPTVKREFNGSSGSLASLVTGGSLKQEGFTYWIAALGSFLLHAVAAMILSPLLLFLGIAAANLLHLAAVSEIGGLANPFWWWAGAVCGFVINRAVLHRSACWVWLCGFGWLVMGVFDAVRTYDYPYALHVSGCSSFQYVLNAFLVLNADRCGEGDSALAGLIFTIPALNSLAYSIGACAAVRYAARVDGTRANL